MVALKRMAASALIGLAGLAQSASADPSDDFGWILIAQVNDGVEGEAVDALVADIMEAARGNTGALVFNFARVADTLYGYELFDNQTAFFEHFSRVEHLVPQIMDLWTPLAIIPTHDLPDDVAGIMEQLGATAPDATAVLVH